MYNHNQVLWIGVRYGKTEREVKQLNAFRSVIATFSFDENEAKDFITLYKAYDRAEYGHFVDTSYPQIIRY
jgi:hypothetical protein